MTNDAMPSKRRWRRPLVVTAGALALAALVWRVYQPRPLVVEVGEVGVGRFEQAIEEDGQLRLKSRYVIAAPTPPSCSGPRSRGRMP
ncbi:MAG: hypothetical protein R3E56_04805 [Burkholderiaceae bacterium]